MTLKIKNKKKVPITRNNNFFGESDFDLEMEFAKEYIEEIANQTIILYRVNLEETKVNDIYKEASKDAVRCYPPIELPVVYEVEDGEVKGYSKSEKGIYSIAGNLNFSVLISTLEEYGCDISRGDYVGVQVDSTNRLYYVVTDDGRLNSMSNNNSLYGTKPYMRDIKCTIVDQGEFRG